MKTVRIDVQGENLVRFSWAHEILPHACETAQKSVSTSQTANPQDLATMTMYINNWFVKNVTFRIFYLVCVVFPLRSKIMKTNQYELV